MTRSELGAAEACAAGIRLAQLTLVRFREFVREPEALFWVFVFPILLAAGLGIAFRNRPADVLQDRRRHPATGARRCARKSCSTCGELARCRRPRRRLRTGKVALLAEPGPDGAVVYRYDDTNPEGRTARMLADRAIQRAAGRTDPGRFQRPPGARARLALHRFPDARACWA